MQLLDGIKIVDFTRLLPGPVATHLLAQMGAEVIKIESPKRMDYVRYSGEQVDGASILFHQINHRKTLKQIDYSTVEGERDLKEIISSSDVLIEQFRPGAMDAWGLGYEDIKKINPTIIYASLTGYGHGNNYSNDAGHDLNYLAYSGISSLMKDENGKPMVADTQFADISGSYMSVMAVQAALLNKARTGKGCFVDISLADAMNPFIIIPFTLYKGGMDYRKLNIINGKTAVNYATYECADTKWIAVAAMETKFWNNICDIVQRPDWKRDNGFELMNHCFPKQEVEELFKSKTQKEWLNLFKNKDVCISPVLEIEELESSDYHKSKAIFNTFETKNGTKFPSISLPFSIKK